MWEVSMGRKIAIVGAGAVGGYAGAHMVQAGEGVKFIDPWPEHVEEMRKHGLRVTPARGAAGIFGSRGGPHLTDAPPPAQEAAVRSALPGMKAYHKAPGSP